MKLSRAYLVSGVDDGGAPRGGGRPTFDPRDPDHFAAAASPVLRPRHACWTAELGACTFADRCLPMYHIRRPMDLHHTVACPHPVSPFSAVSSFV